MKSARASASNASSCPKLFRSGLTILPVERFKRTPPNSVVVTRELVSALACLSNHQAVAAAGVSATPFKARCRLGIC